MVLADSGCYTNENVSALRRLRSGGLCSRSATGRRTEHGEKVAERQYGAATPRAEPHAAEVAEPGWSAAVWAAQGIGGTGLGSTETTAWHAAVSVLPKPVPP